MKKFEHFGRTIRNIRLSHRLTQQQFAAMIDIHPQFVSNAERGLCALPKPALRQIEFKLKRTKRLIELALIRDAKCGVQEFCKQTFQ